MTQEELQNRYDLLLDKVRRLRGMQKEFFKYRAKSDLKRCRVLERDVDKLIEGEVKIIKSKQKDLF